MANFDQIIQWLIYQEDSHTNPGRIINLNDEAGLTRLGLTSRWHQSQLPIAYFSTMGFTEAVQTAKALYNKIYWTPMMLDQIDDQIAAPLLSFAVNKDIPTAAKTLQHVLSITVDGVIGTETLNELNSKDAVIVSKLFRAEWVNFYINDCHLNSDNQRFLSGWTARAMFPYPSNLVPSIYK